MFDWAKTGWSKTSCKRYGARLEDRLGSAEASRPADSDSQLDAHLRACRPCRQALEDARLGRQLLRQAPAPVVERSDRLVARVMASIHEELSRRAAETIWKPVELLGSKFALVAAMVLLLLAAYLAKSTPRLAPPPASRSEIGAVMPESPRPPSGPDEILMSLAGMEGQ